MRRKDVEERAKFLAFKVYMVEQGITPMHHGDFEIIKAEALFWNRVMPGMAP